MSIRFCDICGGSGMKIVHRQGDVVPGSFQNQWSKTVFAGTTYETCDCRVIRATPVPEAKCPRCGAAPAGITHPCVSPDCRRCGARGMGDTTHVCFV